MGGVVLSEFLQSEHTFLFNFDTSSPSFAGGMPWEQSMLLEVSGMNLRFGVYIDEKSRHQCEQDCSHATNLLCCKTLA